MMEYKTEDQEFAPAPFFHFDDDEEDNESEVSVSDFLRQKTMDAINEAWEKSQDSLCLHHVHLDRYTTGLLLQKWEELCWQRIYDGPIKKRFRKIVLDRCWFSGGFAVHLMSLFVNKVGKELKELYIIDASQTGFSIEKPLGLLLGGLRWIDSLECLVVARTDLRGNENGYNLRCLLAKNANLQVLRLYDCIVDDGMYEQVLIGLKYHYHLRFLDLGGWRLNDSQLKSLVDALVYSSNFKQLQFLDISGSTIGEDSLKTLTRLLNECPILQELVLCACERFFGTTRWDSPFFGDFIGAINTSKRLLSIRANKSNISTPLFTAMEATSVLCPVLLDDDDDMEDYALSSSATTTTASTCTTASKSVTAVLQPSATQEEEQQRPETNHPVVCSDDRVPVPDCSMSSSLLFLLCTNE